MANREIQPPGGDLGVKTGGRKAIADFFTLRYLLGGRQGGGRSGGGRTKRELQNDMALMEHQYNLQDQLERARTARGVEGATQTDANAFANISRFYGGGQMIGVNDAHGNPIISEEELNRRPRKGSGKGSGGTAVSWEDPVYPNQQDGPTQDEPIEDEPIQDGPTPIKDEPQGEFNTKDKIRELRVSADKVSKRMKPLTPTQVEDANADWEDFHKAKQDEAKEAGVEIDDDLRNEIRTQYLQGKFSTGKETLPGNYKPDKEVRQWIRDTPTVNPGDGSIDTGSNGTRPAPGGESGVIEGPQFKSYEALQDFQTWEKRQKSRNKSNEEKA